MLARYYRFFLQQCPAAVLCGVLQALLFGIFLVLERFYPHLSRELFFLRYPEGFRFCLGIVLLLFSALSFYRPLAFGLLTTYIICGVRIIDSVQLGQLVRMIIWIIIMFCATWSLFRKYQIEIIIQEEGKGKK